MSKKKNSYFFMAFPHKILAMKKTNSAALTKLKPMQSPMRPPQLAMKLISGSFTDLWNLEHTQCIVVPWCCLVMKGFLKYTVTRSMLSSAYPPRLSIMPAEIKMVPFPMLNGLLSSLSGPRCQFLVQRDLTTFVLVYGRLLIFNNDSVRFLKSFVIWVLIRIIWRVIWPCKNDCQPVFPEMQCTYSLFAKL